MSFALDNDMDYIHYSRESMGESHAGARFYHLACGYAKSAESCRIRYYLLSGISICLPPLILVANAFGELIWKGQYPAYGRGRALRSGNHRGRFPRTGKVP